ncbi:MAG: CBS domain-containing protein [Verrucomicrobia bacterium]|nr:CBS domain-containing protein [Verrucomicrobiota bacterium]
MTIADALTAAFVRLHPVESAQILESIPSHEAAALLDQLTPAVAAPVLASMPTHQAVAVLTIMPADRRGACLDPMPMAAASRILRQFSPSDRAALLDQTPQPRADSLRQSLASPLGSAGATFDPGVLTVPRDVTITRALDMVSHSTTYQHDLLYVVDREQRLTGTLSLRELIRANARDRVDAHATRAEHHLLATDRIPAAADPRWNASNELPVITRQGVFLGILRREAAVAVEPPPATDSGGLIGGLLTASEYCWTGLATLLDTAAAQGHSATMKERT